MRFLGPAICAAMLLATPAFAQTARPFGPPVTGVVQSFNGKTLMLKKADGKIVSTPLAPNARIMLSVKKTLADIKPGDFIASDGTRGPDGKIHANEIRIFSAPGGEGQFPMSQPDHVMTNATVTEVMTDATVKQVSGTKGMPIIKLTFHGAEAPGAANCTGRAADAPGGPGKGCIGKTEFDVPAGTPVVAIQPAEPSSLKPGAKVSVNVTKAADGSSSAIRVTILQ